VLGGIPTDYTKLLIALEPLVEHAKLESSITPTVSSNDNNLDPNSEIEPPNIPISPNHESISEMKTPTPTSSQSISLEKN
jgi:hypothetical protein